MSNEMKQAYVAIMHKCVPAAEWASKNPVLARGELGIELDTKKFKFGDGVTAWTSLEYATRVEIADVNGLLAALNSYLAESKEYTNQTIEEVSKTFEEIVCSIYGNDFQPGLEPPTIREIANEEAQSLIDKIEFPETDLSNYYTKDETYEKEEIDEKLDAITAGDIELNNYYTKAETDERLGTKVPTTRTINDKPLTSNIKLGATDVGAAPAIHNHDYISVTQKGAANGVAELDENGKVSTSQLPSYVDDVIEGIYNKNSRNFYTDPDDCETSRINGEPGKIYVDINTNKPTYFSTNSEPVTLKKDEFVSPATADASNVFPVPGGP